MHSGLYNRAILRIAIKPRGPLLIRAGHTAEENSLPFEHNVETPHGNSAAVPFIPGSSLKGVIRNHYERVAGSCGIRVCDLFSNSACGRETRADSSTSDTEGEFYASSLCAACKVFGCDASAGRFWVEDAMPSQQNPPTRQLRATLPIDRLLGSGRSASAADFEAVVGGEFETRIILENFELWQLGMIGIVLMDIDDGLVQIGGLRSKGYGLVSLNFDSCEFFFAKPGLPTERIYGVGSLVSEKQRGQFGYMTEDWLVLKLPSRSETGADQGMAAAIKYDIISDVFGLKYVVNSNEAVRSLFSMLLRNLLDYVSQQRTSADRTAGKREE
ncbi:MAG: hypothetical protein JW941_11825 [Candidatus Coatesbacteria bacterium]|nr:hypothetical protein [Candidatus Coatesbacteria bacterium]